MLVIAGCDSGFRVGSRCISEHTENTGLILGLANRSAEQLRIRWDVSETDDTQNPNPDSTLKTLNVVENETFNLEKFGNVDSDTINELSRLIDMDGQSKNQIIEGRV